jgi:hypothetical protein
VPDCSAKDLEEMKVSFSWLDRKGKTPWPIRPRFKKYWSGQLWYFSIWKWNLCLDFRKGNLFTWMLDDIKKRKWFDILRSRNN